MGFSHSWIAVKGLEAHTALETMGVEVVRELDAGDFPEPLGMGRLPGGWLLVVSNDFDDAFKGRLAQLAQLGPAVACAIEEHVMYSEARGYEAGRETWRVVHDSSDGIYRIDVTGNPPDGFEAIHQAAVREQDAEGGEEADVDYLFDVPPRVAASICGYELGEPEPDGFRYSELRRTRAAGKVGRPGFFARLFGAR